MQQTEKSRTDYYLGRHSGGGWGYNKYWLFKPIDGYFNVC